MRALGVLAVLAVACGGDDGTTERPPPPGDERDADGDGVTVDRDCDDADEGVAPGVDEVPYDGVDNDCDAATPDDDLDGDGALAADDCDDGDPERFPGASERCDGVDQDCDATADEGATDARTFFPDDDRDGQGDGDRGVRACAPPAEYVANGDDCDDTDERARLGGEERCGDGVDGDCDGQIDEADAVDAKTWYGDADADGVGDAAFTTVACAAPAAFVAVAGDCDDADAATFPGAAEVCGDGVDQDCDASPDDGC